MKGFIEKLIGRLEECKKIEKCNLYSGIEEEFGYSHCSDAFEDGQTLGAFNAYSDMLDFIKELAEEYNNGFCEWKLDGVYLLCQHNTELVISCLEEEKHRYTYCPICGKKIKVVE